jgi:hypothetical protein
VTKEAEVKTPALRSTVITKDNIPSTSRMNLLKALVPLLVRFVTETTQFVAIALETAFSQINYSAKSIRPSIINFPLTTGTPVPGWPPPMLIV